MSCTIKINAQGVVSVFAENGKKSQLYKNINKQTFVESELDALVYYQAALEFKNKGYLSDNNDEPILMFAVQSTQNQLALPNKTVYTSSYKEALKQDKENKGIEVGFVKLNNPTTIEDTKGSKEFFSQMRNTSLNSNNQVIGRSSSGVVVITDSSANNFKPITKINTAAKDDTLASFVTNLVRGNQLRDEKVPVSALTEESTISFQLFDMGQGKISVMAVEDNKRVGVLRLIKSGDKIVVKEVLINEDYKSKGIGRELYFTAFDELGQEIYSDEFQTPAAKTLWESLVSSGFAERLGPKTTTVTKRTEEVTKGVEAVRKIAAEYKKLNKIKGTAPLVVTALETTVSEEMAREYELVEDRPNNPEVKKSYAALITETIAQYDFIVGKGLNVEKYQGKGEPYQDSKEMLEDLRTNNTLKFLPNDEAFGEGAEIYKDSIGLQPSGRFLEDGYQLTNSEVFRIVHDYFGHGILGNQFGAIGEENATLQHLDLYSDVAKPAVVFQTRGQNSWVNFSGENKEVFSMFAEARKLKNEGKTEEAKKLLDKAREAFKFAKPKEGIFKNKYNFKKYDTARRIREQEQIERANDGGTNDSNDLRNSLPIISKDNVTTRGINRRNRQGDTKIQSYVLKNVTEISLPVEVQAAIKKAFPKITTFPKIFEIKDGAVYRELKMKGLEGVPMASSVTIHSAAKYDTMRMFVTEDGYTGITITKDGHLGGAFSSEKSGRSADLAQLMVIGVKEGATNAEAFDTFLPNYYTKFGFKGVSTVAFSEEIAEKNGWNYEEYKKYNNGKPDVVHFIYDGGSRDTIEERLDQFDTYSDYQKEEVKKFDKNSYDESYKYMEAEVVKRYNFEKEQNRKGYKLTSSPSAVNFQLGLDSEAIQQEEITQSVIGRLEQSGLADNIFQFSQEQITTKLESLGKTDTNVKGFLVTENGQKNVYINKDNVTLDTPLHEVAGHAMLDFTKQKARPIYDKGINLVNQELRKENSEIQDVIDYVKETQPDLTGEALSNEILAEYIGRVGAELVNKQKKSKLEQWVSSFWNYIKSAIGIFDKEFNLENATIRDFAEAMNISTLRGDNVSEQAQYYFTRVADRLPLTLAVFNTKPFQDLIGKKVNPVTIQQLLNQTGIKQIEKDLIKKVISENYLGQKKVDYNELEATVRANIMPLERIVTSTHATYGMGNLGGGDYGDANSIIFNAPIEHGIVGDHFPNDFNASGRKNVKYISKQLDSNTWVAVEEGYESQANENNIYQFVGTAGSKEAVDTWVDSYNSTSKPWVVFEDQSYLGQGYLPSKKLKSFDTAQEAEEWIESNKENYKGLLDYIESEQIEDSTNKGMFGHIRTWQDDTTFYVAELQSDYFQKYKAREQLMEINPEFKKVEQDYIYKGNEIAAERDIYLQNNVHLDLLEEIEKNPRVEVYLYRLRLEDSTLEEEKLWLFVDGKPTFASRNYGEDYSEEMQRVGILKGRNEVLRALKEKLGEEFANNLQEFYTKKLQYFVDVQKKLEKDYNKQTEEFLKNAPIQIKQFIASQKEWEKRMVRESIKEAALSGATTLRFPTPYTISVIEGYIKGANGSAVELLDGTDVGDMVGYLGKYYVIMANNGSDIDILPSTKVLGFDLESYIKDKQNDKVYEDMRGVIVGNEYDIETVKWEIPYVARNYLNVKLAEKDTEEGGLGIEKVKITLTEDMYNDIEELVMEMNKENILSNPKQYFENIGYYNVVVENGQVYYTTENLSTENVSLEQKESTKDTFDIESLSETQQTVARKYVEIANVLKNERGEENLEVVTDENGFDWYETKIEESESQKPVIAFQKTAEQKVFELIQSGEIEATCKL